MTQLKQIAQQMVSQGKGILAMDESHPTNAKRFEALGIPTTEQKRREYRDMLLTTPGLSNYISGAILFDETIRQKTLADQTFVDYMNANGMVPGIKVDLGLKDLNDKGEKHTQGMDDLAQRLAEYYELGARFAKWRAVYNISDTLPSQECVDCNADGLAKYAKLCQEAGIVPIVEPEVLIDGSHDLEMSFERTRNAQKKVFEKLAEYKVDLEGMILKPSMVISGKEASNRASVKEVASRTIDCLKETVPSQVAGIAFLSGGQTDQESAEHLSIMNAVNKDLPWRVTFSYGRALQHAAMVAWHGQPENKEKGQKVFLHRARMNSLAAKGEYSPEMENELSI